MRRDLQSLAIGGAPGPLDTLAHVVLAALMGGAGGVFFGLGVNRWGDRDE